MGEIILEKEGFWGRITMKNPDKKNAINFEMWKTLKKGLLDFEQDGDIKIIILEGYGEEFSAGADISEFKSLRMDEDRKNEYNSLNESVYSLLENILKPTIAHIKGYCIGGGLGLALKCDLRIADLDAKFSLPAAKRGVGYNYDGLKDLSNLVGTSRARELVFTGAFYGAEEAERIGLINFFSKESDELVFKYVKMIGENAPLTIKASKAVFLDVNRDEKDYAWCDKLKNECFASEDFKEASNAFMEKRKPDFKGK